MDSSTALPVTARNQTQLWDAFVNWQNREPGRYSIAGGLFDEPWCFWLVVSADGTLMYEAAHPDYAPISTQHPWQDYGENRQQGCQLWEPKARQIFGDLVCELEEQLAKRKRNE